MSTIDESTSGSDSAAWIVTGGAFFTAAADRGRVSLIQLDDTLFAVGNTFWYDSEATDDITRRLIEQGVDADEAARRVDAARTFIPSADNPTDLASVPAFMRWFENSYGPHTLAAILHDEQIRAEPNSGTLGSDALADRFFREMLRSAAVPWLKRWVMWSAVAMRSRFEADRLRRGALIVWVLLALVGITAAVAAAGGWLGVWSPPVDAGVLALVAGILPVVAAPLWGKQIGAGLIAAIVGVWLVPAATFALAGGLVYAASERVAQRVGLS